MGIIKTFRLTYGSNIKILLGRMNFEDMVEIEVWVEGQLMMGKMCYNLIQSNKPINFTKRKIFRVMHICDI